MRKFIITAAATLALAAPAFAQDATSFAGARVGATLGYDRTHGRDGFTYGGSFGYDHAITPKITLGAEATFEDSSTKFRGIHASRDLAISARAGYVVIPSLLAFAKVGYDTTRIEVVSAGHTNLEGVRFGGGLEYAVIPHVYLSAEYRRTQYEDNFGGRDAGIVGVGYRF